MSQLRTLNNRSSINIIKNNQSVDTSLAQLLKMQKFLSTQINQLQAQKSFQSKSVKQNIREKLIEIRKNLRHTNREYFHFKNSIVLQMKQFKSAMESYIVKQVNTINKANLENKINYRINRFNNQLQNGKNCKKQKNNIETSPIKTNKIQNRQSRYKSMPKQLKQIIQNIQVPKLLASCKKQIKSQLINTLSPIYQTKIDHNKQKIQKQRNDVSIPKPFRKSSMTNLEEISQQRNKTISSQLQNSRINQSRAEGSSIGLPLTLEKSNHLSSVFNKQAQAKYTTTVDNTFRKFMSQKNQIDIIKAKYGEQEVNKFFKPNNKENIKNGQAPRKRQKSLRKIKIYSVM